MSHFSIPARMIFIAIVVLTLGSRLSWAIEQPDCTTLAKWSTGHKTTDTITLAPKVVISGMFADDRTEPVYATAVASWTRNDFNQVGRWLKDCRRTASKQRDKTASDLLYKAYKLVSKTARPVGNIDKFRQHCTRAVDNLIGYHRSDDLNKVLELARQALQGADVASEMNNLSVSRSVKNEVRTIQNASGYLTPGDVETLSAKLGQGATAVKQEMAAQNKEFEALKRELAVVPMTHEGARTLDRLNKHPVLRKVSRQEAMDFHNAVMKKRQAISYAVQQQKAQKKAAAAAVPIKVAAHMEKLIRGDSIEEISLRGVKPGIPYLYAKKFMSTRFSYKAATGGDVLKEFGPTRGDTGRFKQTERRDGGHFELETMGKTVGQVKFTEHYTGPMDLNEPRNWLMERFGKPDQFKFLGNAIIMSWNDDGMNLMVSPGNRTTLPYRSPREYKSSLVITMWSDDYKEYLIAAKKRCNELRNQPMSELSVQDKMDIMKGCKS